VGVHSPSCGGLSLLDEEQATMAARAAAAAKLARVGLGRRCTSDVGRMRMPNARRMTDARLQAIRFPRPHRRTLSSTVRQSARASERATRRTRRTRRYGSCATPRSRQARQRGQAR
jgi:hypothetical protein